MCQSLFKRCKAWIKWILNFDYWKLPIVSKILTLWMFFWINSLLWVCFAFILVRWSNTARNLYQNLCVSLYCYSNDILMNTLLINLFFFFTSPRSKIFKKGESKQISRTKKTLKKSKAWLIGEQSGFQKWDGS